MIPSNSDRHTIFVECSKFITGEEIIGVFKSSLDEYNKTSKNNIDCNFYINMILDKEDQPYGKSFVYISNSKVYDMLCEERFEYIDDPTWVDPPRKRKISNSLSASKEKKDSLNNSGCILNVDWSEIMEADEEYERKEQEALNSHVCPKIKVNIGTCLKLLPYITDDHSETFNLICVGPTEIKDGYYHNIIKCTNVPESINRADLKARFRIYATDSVSIHKRKYKGKMIDDTYPHINMTSDRVAYIIYDNNTNDARFAMYMTKKTWINGSKLWFEFSHKRDIHDDFNKSNRYNDRSPSKNNYNDRSPGKNNYNDRSPGKNNYNDRSPSKNNYNDRSPSKNNYNDRSPSKNNYNDRSPSKNNYINITDNSNNSNNTKNSKNSKNSKNDIIDTDGYHYVRYNRK
jgi:hypothetical protein